MNTARTIRILILEDSPEDTELIERELRKGGAAIQTQAVASRPAFIAALAEFAPDLVVSDYKLPDLDGWAALEIAKASKPNLPVIIVSGTLGDEPAMALIKAGACDYFLKDRLARLAPAVQRALAEQRGQRDLHLFREALDESIDGIYIIDPANSRILDCNRAAAANGGYTRDEMLALSVVDLDPELADPAQWLALVERIRAAGRITLERHSRRKDGSLFPIEVNVSYVTARSGDYLIAIVRDISERRRTQDELRHSQERLRAYLEHAPVCAWFKDEQGRMLYVNPCWERSIGKTLAQVRGQDDRALWPEPIATTLRAHDVRVLDTNTPIEIEVDVPAAGAVMRSWRVYKFPLPDSSGTRMIGGMAMDVTEHRQAEAVLKRRAEELERFHALSVGRELQMIELKKEVNALLRTTGQKPRYDLAFLDGVGKAEAVVP